MADTEQNLLNTDKKKQDFTEDELQLITAEKQARKAAKDARDEANKAKEEADNARLEVKKAAGKRFNRVTGVAAAVGGVTGGVAGFFAASALVSTLPFISAPVAVVVFASLIVGGTIATGGIALIGAATAMIAYKASSYLVNKMFPKQPIQEEDIKNSKTKLAEYKTQIFEEKNNEANEKAIKANELYASLKKAGLSRKQKEEDEVPGEETVPTKPLTAKQQEKQDMAPFTQNTRRGAVIGAVLGGGSAAFAASLLPFAGTALIAGAAVGGAVVTGGAGAIVVGAVMLGVAVVRARKQNNQPSPDGLENPEMQKTIGLQPPKEQAKLTEQNTSLPKKAPTPSSTPRGSESRKSSKSISK